MQTLTPYEYGQRAYAAGINAPALDKEFLATLPSGPIGATTPAMMEWHRGWTKANLAAPCPATDDYTATYSPEDNKLRLFSVGRLDSETYSRVRAAGFVYAPKQELFVAPAWSPEREDLLLELCGEIGDEDTSLVDRAQVRAERFTDYKNKRAHDAERARAGVQAITDGIPLGQPILIGHHSERHARKDAERIEAGMTKAVRMWETSEYWKRRAAGALAAAKYKERPEVRARRIKTLEAEKRRHERALAEDTAALKFWNAPGLDMRRAQAIANRFSVSQCFPLAEYPRTAPASQYEGMMSLWSALNGGIITPEQARDIATARHNQSQAYALRFLAHLDNRLAYEKAMLEESGYTPPPKAKTSAELPLLNYSGTVAYRNPYHRSEIIRGEAHHMTKAEFAAINKDYKGTRVSECGTHRLRTAMLHNPTRLVAVFLTDSKQHQRPGAGQVEAKAQEEEAAATRRLEIETSRLAATTRAHAEARQQRESQEQEAAPFRQLKEQLRQGVLPVAVPQLFPTPLDLARRMVELAKIESGNRVLEPSAGTGNILGSMGCRMFGHNPERGEVVAVEKSPKLAESLRHNFPLTQVHAKDFLECNGDLGKFDRILMNPPFANAQDIDHIKHALAMLRPGGRLVALCANGPRQQDALRPLAETWEELPAGTFEGTGVRAVLLAISHL